MAKKKNSEITPSTLGSFSKLNDLLNTIAPDGEMLDINPIARIDEWIPTGWYILNAALSGSLFGGLPNRRSLALAGAEGSGKSFIALSICRMAQQRDYTIIYFDSEGAIDVEFVTRLGLNISKVRLQPVSTIEEFTHIAAQIAKNIKEEKDKNGSAPKIMVVLDSLGNLSSEKEKEDTIEGKDKRDMTKQQKVRQMFRVIGLDYAKLGIPVIINAHTYECIFEEAKVKMSDNSFININKIQIDDEVLTLNGPKKVLNTFEYEIKNPIELILEDGYVIKCSDAHKFAVEDENNNLIWKTADELQEGDEILSID